MDRFWDKVDQKTSKECWHWLASSVGGYGQFHFSGKMRKAHRVAAYFAGILSDLDNSEQLVLHKCDNPICVNPHHLEVGDYSKNLRDAYQRGLTSHKGLSYKTKTSRCRGSKNPRAKLNEEVVKQIRDLYARGVSQTDLALQFNMSRPAICQIVHRTRWKHV